MEFIYNSSENACEESEEPIMNIKLVQQDSIELHPITIHEYYLNSHINISNYAQCIPSTKECFTLDYNIAINLMNSLNVRKQCVCLCDMDVIRKYILQHTKNGQLLDIHYKNLSHSSIVLIKGIIYEDYNMDKTKKENIEIQFITSNQRITPIVLNNMLKLAIILKYSAVVVILDYNNEIVKDVLKKMDKSLLDYFQTSSFEFNSSFSKEMFQDIMINKKCVLM